MATVIRVLELAGDLVQPEVSQNLIALIAEGAQDAEGEDQESALRSAAVDTFAEMLNWDHIPEQLLHLIAWVLGEYGQLCGKATLDDLAHRLADLAADDARLRGLFPGVSFPSRIFSIFEGGEGYVSFPPVAVRERIRIFSLLLLVALLCRLDAGAVAALDGAPQDARATRGPSLPGGLSRKTRVCVPFDSRGFRACLLCRAQK